MDMGVQRSIRINEEIFACDGLYRAIFEYSNDSIFVCLLSNDGLPGKYIEVNSRFIEQTGYTKAELFTMTPLEMVVDGSFDLADFQNNILKDEQFSLECKYKTKSGQVRLAEISAHVLNLAGQQLLVGFGRDIFERKQAEVAYQICKEKNQALLKAIPDTIFCLSRKGFILAVQAGTADKLIKPTDEILGMHISKLLPRRIVQLTMQHIQQAFATKTLQTYDYEMFLHGRYCAWEVRMSISGPNEVMVIVRDITESKEREKKLRYLSLHDSLTGIYNRAFIEQEMYRIQQAEPGPVGIIMCDVDRLKQVNDTMGHSSGDNLLVVAANVIKKAVRKGDIVARIGGDEFAILLPQSDLATARSIYERIRHGVAMHNQNNPRFPISMSIGYAVRNGEAALSMAELLKKADFNMYKEKMQHGK